MMSRILLAWDPDLSVIIGCVALGIAYVIACRKLSPDSSRDLTPNPFPLGKGDRQRAQKKLTPVDNLLPLFPPSLKGRGWGLGLRWGWAPSLFLLGDLVMLLALISPLDVLADDYLFSAHMLQHMLLILAVPPLLILGIPRALATSIVRVPALGAIERMLRNPGLAWTLGMAALWIWHVPRLYDATLASEPLHIFEHLVFLVTATIFWWPILAPLEQSRMNHGAAFAYLGGAMLITTVLGILITFAPVGAYTAYLHPEDSLHILAGLRDSWGLTTESDQEFGGLLMWVPGGLVYLCAIMAVLARWYRAPQPAHLAHTHAGVSHGA
jgi:cytochrome c oxidase assembly factor CtaG